MKKITDDHSSVPVIKVSKRMNISLGKKVLFIACSILLAIVIGAIFMGIAGFNPIKFYIEVFKGNFSRVSMIGSMIRIALPLMITSLGISLAFKMRFWNIGAEGQFICGALLAMTVGLLLGDSLPSPLGAIICILVGMLGSGILAAIPALLKVRFKTNETILTLMFNYILLYLVQYFVKLDFFRDPEIAIPTFVQLDSSLWLHEIGKQTSFYLDTAFFIGIVLVIMLSLYFRYTKHGYEIAVVGDSPNTARYSGMKVSRIIVRTVFLSGAVIGLAGALQLLGANCSHRMSTGITSSVGWTGIIVAWLAKLNPIGIAITSLLMAILEKGCSWAQSSMNIDSSLADIFQGLILFCVLAGDFLINYEIKFKGRTLSEIINSKKQKKKKAADTSAMADEVQNNTVTDDQTTEGVQEESDTATGEACSQAAVVAEAATAEAQPASAPVKRRKK